MSETITPEDRAKAIYDMAHGALWHVDAIPAIAAAIRDAENAAHEMDAEWCDTIVQRSDQMPADVAAVVAPKTLSLVARNFASVIRSFKHPESA